MPAGWGRHAAGAELKAGDYVMARILSATGGSLKGEVVEVRNGTRVMASVKAEERGT